MKIKFYFENTRQAGNCICMHFNDKWYYDSAVFFEDAWCGIDLYENDESANKYNFEEYYAPTINRLKAFLENPEKYGQTFKYEYIDVLDEIKEREGKTVEEVREMENSDANQFPINMVYVGEYELEVPENKKIFVACRDTGELIREVSSIEEAQKCIEEYEKNDKRDGIYEPNYYDIVNEEQVPLVD